MYYNLIAKRIGELRLERITGKLQRDALLELEAIYAQLPKPDALIALWMQ